ncbi:hypothetical protein GHT06_006517 [Daphnia sinensis]|uniref:Integrase catalytic domain-containing protein n=1 Tax=Daphnia sinensis TaxID=1820382 RepID=A0AAD5KF61_9CRUS|nr:hypothetical protein GHT06_006517 [Daphnia sinensis]
MGNHETVIQKLRERCNAGLNRHVWRQHFALSKQRANEAADNWLCGLRDLARMCELATDCCANCQPTRILGQIVYGVYDDEIRRKLREQGATLTLDQAIEILRVAEAASKQATNLKTGDAAAIQTLAKSAYKKNKTQRQSNKQPKEDGKSDGCWNCGSQPRIASMEEMDFVEAGIQPSGSEREILISILPDTGAQIDAIPADMYRNEIPESKLLPRGTNAITAIGSTIVSRGTFKATIRWPTGYNSNSKSINTTFHVLQDLKQPILSKKTQKALGMLPAGYPHESINAITKEEPRKDPGSIFFPHLMASVVINPTEERKKEDLKKLTEEFPRIFDGVCRPMVGPAFHDFFIRGTGAPVKFWSDNGPQFNAVEFKDFARDWGISIGNSSPHYPQSNGFAEAAISSMKKLIAGSWRKGSFDANQFAKSLLLFRNALRSGAASPAQMVFNRPLRDALPAHRRSFAPEWQQKAYILEKRARRAKDIQIEHYNRTAHALQPFSIGDHVIVQHPISKYTSGRLFRRNRRMLLKRVPVMPGYSTPGPSIYQPNATTRRTRGKAKVYTNLAPRRSTRKKERPARYSD